MCTIFQRIKIARTEDQLKYFNALAKKWSKPVQAAVNFFNKISYLILLTVLDLCSIVKTGLINMEGL